MLRLVRLYSLSCLEGCFNYSFYYMASSVSGQDESNPTLWLANQAGQMVLSSLLRIACCILQQNGVLYDLTGLVKISRYFCGPVYEPWLHCVLVHITYSKLKELGQYIYPVILTGLSKVLDRPKKSPSTSATLLSCTVEWHVFVWFFRKMCQISCLLQQ